MLQVVLDALAGSLEDVGSKFDKGPYIKDVRKISGIFDPSSPLSTFGDEAKY